jgi:hypothetical protein
VTVDPFTSAGPKAEDTRERNAKRDTKGRYLIPKLPELLSPEGHIIPIPPEGARGAGDTPWTRATTFAKSISDTYTLSAWSQRMAVKGLASRADLVLAAAACPVSDKGTLDSIVEQAKDAAAARASANLGTAMHNLTQDVDQGRLTDLSTLPESAQRDLRAYAALLAEHGIEMMPGYTEKTVVNDTFGIAGTFDRIVMYRGRPTVLDLKTGRDLQYGWNEIGIQLAIYANADAIFDWDQEVFLPMPEELDKATGLVIHLPVGRGVAELYEVSLEAAWAACQLCHDVRKWRSNRKLSRLVTVAAPNTPGAVLQVEPPDIGESAHEAAIQALPGMPNGPALNAGNAHVLASDLAPMADTAKGERGCSVCGRKGHRKGSAKCLGDTDPARAARTVARVAAESAPLLAEEDEPLDFCPRTGPCSGAGWTAPPEDSTEPWVCGNCGKPSRTGQIKGDGVPVQGTIGMPAAAPALGTEPITPEEVADPFADAPEPAAARPPTWLERINAASSKGELRDIRAEATAAGAWTPDLQVAGIARIGVISEDAG